MFVYLFVKYLHITSVKVWCLKAQAWAGRSGNGFCVLLAEKAMEVLDKGLRRNAK